MKLHYLKEFSVLAREGRYLDAAEELFISQATLSRHIMMLENELDVRLFERTTRGAELTPEGKRILPFAEKVTRLVDGYETAIREQSEADDAILAIGYNFALAGYGLLERIRRFEQSNSDISVRLTRNLPDKLERGLLSGDFDCVFLQHQMDYVPPASITFHQVLKDEMIVLCSQEHPMAGRDAVSLEELSGELVVLPDPAGSLTNIGIPENFPPAHVVKGVSGTGIVHCVMELRAVSVIPRTYATFFIGSTTGLRLIPLSPELCVSLSLMLVSEETSPLLKRFLTYMNL